MSAYHPNEIDEIKIDLSQPIDRITLSPPAVSGGTTTNSETATGISDITDDTGKPYIIKIHKVVHEEIHDAGNRAYFDLSLDDVLLEVFQKIDKQLYEYVLNYHANDDWFGKQAPSDIIQKYCRPLVTQKPSKPRPYVRVKTSYNKKQPNLLLTTSSVENPEEGTCETVHTLNELVGKRIVYEVQLKRIRFCPTTFNPELKLVKLHQYIQAEEFNPLNLLLNNKNHADRRDEILANQKEMEAKKEHLLKLKTLKEEVEREVATVIAKRNDIDEKFKVASETVEAMRRAAEIDGYSDATEAPIMRDVDDILDDIEAQEKVAAEDATPQEAAPCQPETNATDDTPADVTADDANVTAITTQTDEPATHTCATTAADTTCTQPPITENAPDNTCKTAVSNDDTAQNVDNRVETVEGVDMSSITENVPATDTVTNSVQQVVAEEVDTMAKEVTFSAGATANGVTDITITDAPQTDEEMLAE